MSDEILEGQKLVTERVIEDLKGRTELGLKKYGRPLTTFDGRSSLQDLYEELLDACQYVKKMLMEQEAIEEQVNRSMAVFYAQPVNPDDEPIK